MLCLMQQCVTVTAETNSRVRATKTFAPNVRHLDPEPATFEAMLEGWAPAAHPVLQAATVAARLDVVRRFAEFSNQYPWQWRPAEVRRSSTCGPAAAAGGVHGAQLQMALRMFCDYVTDVAYGWAGVLSGSGRLRCRSP